LRRKLSEAWRARSELRRQTPARNHVAALEALLATAGIPPEGEIQLCYALGKEFEDLGRYDEAFGAFFRRAKNDRGIWVTAALADGTLLQCPPFLLVEPFRVTRMIREIEPGDDSENDGRRSLQNENPSPSRQSETV